MRKHDPLFVTRRLSVASASILLCSSRASTCTIKSFNCVRLYNSFSSKRVSAVLVLHIGSPRERSFDKLPFMASPVFFLPLHCVHSLKCGLSSPLLTFLVMIHCRSDSKMSYELPHFLVMKTGSPVMRCGCNATMYLKL